MTSLKKETCLCVKISNFMFTIDCRPNWSRCVFIMLTTTFKYDSIRFEPAYNQLDVNYVLLAPPSRCIYMVASKVSVRGHLHEDTFVNASRYICIYIDALNACNYSCGINCMFPYVSSDPVSYEHCKHHLVCVPLLIIYANKSTQTLCKGEKKHNF